MRALTARANGNRILVARLLVVESLAQAGRKAQGGGASDEEIRRAVAQVRRDVVRRFLIVEISRETWLRAEALAERHRVKGADAVHLAAACLVHERRLARGAGRLTFVTCDADQIKAGTAEGLVVENPVLSP